ncbi:hypothetical protein [Nonomuraea sp. NPDC050310]|uniref:hypothetical protein n=1 Tax=Nonomuraea sp. NPDC050310 TaxID=3154935 RepID=UPI00340264C8
MAPAEVIANVLHHEEDTGLNDEDALSFAGDILHALDRAGMVVVSAEDLRDTLREADKAYAMTFKSNSAMRPAWTVFVPPSQNWEHRPPSRALVTECTVTFVRHGRPDQLTFCCRADAERFAWWLDNSSAGIDAEIAEMPAPSPGRNPADA